MFIRFLLLSFLFIHLNWCIISVSVNSLVIIGYGKDLLASLPAILCLYVCRNIIIIIIKIDRLNTEWVKWLTLTPFFLCVCSWKWSIRCDDCDFPLSICFNVFPFSPNFDWLNQHLPWWPILKAPKDSNNIFIIKGIYHRQQLVKSFSFLFVLHKLYRSLYWLIIMNKWHHLEPL